MVEQENPTSSAHTRLNLPGEDDQEIATAAVPLLLSGHPSPSLSSQFKTFANVFISIVGAGVLRLLYTFKKAGYLSGTLILFSVAALTYHCMMLLIQTHRKVVHHHKKINSLGDLGFAVCRFPGRFTVDAMIFLSQAWFCVSYTIFVATSLAFVFNFDFSTKQVSNPPALTGLTNLTPKSMFIWRCFPFQLGLNSIPTLTHLASLSIFADVIDKGASSILALELYLGPIWIHIVSFIKLS